ncbi:hypothetical protein BaRGS_00023550 [Batillaria attramentaria]|uniref:Uncharacterized protein n=1 Tax=Batillaria attramentaria TaxID=370345 RepID=A0ABD0KDD8_9CAEN
MSHSYNQTDDTGLSAEEHWEAYRAQQQHDELSRSSGSTGYSLNIFKREKDITQLKDDLARATRAIEASKGENHRLDEKCGNLETVLQDEKQKNRNLYQEKENLQKQASFLEKDLAVAKQRIENLEQRLDDEARRHTCERRRLEEDHDREEQKLKQEKRELQAEIQKAQRGTEEQRRSHADEVKWLQKSYTKDIEDTKAKNNAQIKKLHEDHERTIQSLKKDLEETEKSGQQKLQIAVEELEKEKSEVTTLQGIIQSLQQEKETRQREFDKEITMLKDQNKNDNEKLHISHSGELTKMADKMERMKAEHVAELRNMRENFERQQNRMQRNDTDDQIQSLRDELERLQIMRNNDMQRISQQKKEETEALEMKHKRQIQALTAEIDNIHRHYKGQIQFLREDMEEEKRMMQRRQESVIQAGEQMLERRDQFAREALSAAQQRNQEFTSEGSYTHGFPPQ